MYLFFMLLLFLVGPPAIAQSTDRATILGVFVDEKYDFQRIEFCENGDYYQSNTSRGTYEIIDGEIHCKELGLSYSHLKYRIEGEGLTDEVKERLIRSKSFVYPWKERIPYEIRFQDKVTGEFLTNLRVSYEIRNPSGKYIAPTVRGFEIDEDGSMVIDAPQSCSIYLQLHAEYIHCTKDDERLIVRSTDLNRSKVVQVERGQSVSGIVVHAGTRQPVPNARITPLCFGVQLNYSDFEKAILSDKDGRFHLQCVDEECGFNVEHPLFRPITEKRFPNGEKTEGVVIELDPGDSLRGTVRNQLGQPLKDVDVSIQDQESTTTDEEGNFELHGLDLSSKKTVIFSSDEYESVIRAITGIDEISVSMSPKPRLKIEVPPEYVREGMVLSAGPCAAQNKDLSYTDFASKRIDSKNRDLVLFFYSVEEFQNCKEIWVGAQASGRAFWETHISLSKQSSHDRLIVQPKFPEGFSIRGRIKTDSVDTEQLVKKKLVVRVTPEEIESTNNVRVKRERVVMGTHETEVDDQGNFELKNALPGKYLLEIDGCLPTTYQKDIVVAESDLSLGDIEIKKFGTLRGSIDFLPEEQEDFIFTTCEISYHPTWFESLSAEFLGSKPAPWKPFEIMTDEKGEFVAENVPAGEVQVSLSGFMRGSRAAIATVRTGKTSKVVIKE